jgi:hypothetical protein
VTARKANSRISSRSPLPAGTALLVASLLVVGCKGGTFDTRAADQAASYKTDYRPVESIQTPEGFRAVLVAEGFNYPSSMTWDAAGKLYVLESHTVPIPTLKVKVMRIGAAGKLEEIALRGPGAPAGAVAIGIEFHHCWLYLSHEEKDGTW